MARECQMNTPSLKNSGNYGHCKYRTPYTSLPQIEMVQLRNLFLADNYVEIKLVNQSTKCLASLASANCNPKNKRVGALETELSPIIFGMAAAKSAPRLHRL